MRSKLYNLDRMLLYSPGLAAGWNGLFDAVRGDRMALSPRLRELAICLVAILNRADYELHHHAPYLDDESRAQEQRMHFFGVALVTHAQAQGRMRAGPPEVLSALIIGAFTGLVRVVREGRVVRDAAASELAEAACWDLVRA